jgi:imidazolonepropionase-like amidohydrolase
MIADGSMLIRDGRIVSVGHSRRIENLGEARQAEVIEVHGAVVMPTFVDADVTLPESPAGARRLLQLAFTHGTGAIGARVPHGLLRSLPAPNPKGPQVLPLLDIAAEFDAGQINRAVRRNLAPFLRIDLLAHSRDALRFVHALGLAVRAYVERPEQRDWIGLALAYGADVLELPREPLDAAQRMLLSGSNAIAVLGPGTLAMGRGLVDGGAAVALSSGFREGCGGTCSMQMAVLRAAGEGGLEIAEAITLATINAAHALGVAGHAGSLEAGKAADFLVLHLPDFRELSSFSGVNMVAKVFKAGTLVI